MKLTLHSDEINLLIYRYLEESGFSHTAFNLKTEANLLQPVTLPISVCGESGGKTSTTNLSLLEILGHRLPPNCLVAMLQKALLYIWIEYHTDFETGMEIQCNQPFGLFSRHECELVDEAASTQSESEEENEASIDMLVEQPLSGSVEDTQETQTSLKSSSSAANTKKGIIGIRSTTKTPKRRKLSPSSKSYDHNPGQRQFPVSSCVGLSKESFESSADASTERREEEDEQQQHQEPFEVESNSYSAPHDLPVNYPSSSVKQQPTSSEATS